MSRKAVFVSLIDFCFVTGTQVGDSSPSLSLKCCSYRHTSWPRTILGESSEGVYPP